MRWFGGRDSAKDHKTENFLKISKRIYTETCYKNYIKSAKNK